MKIVSKDQMFLPKKETVRVVAGVTKMIEWDYVVVYVRNKQAPYDTPTNFYFTFYGSGDYYLDEVCNLVEQWTYFRGVCHKHYEPGSHEYNRAKLLACTTVATFRRNYLKKYGSPPNPLGLRPTLDINLIKPKKDHSKSLKQKDHRNQVKMNL